VEKVINNVYIHTVYTKMSAKKRRPIQLQPKVKQKFDDLHRELKKETQSETVELLVDFYRSNGLKVRV